MRRRWRPLACAAVWTGCLAAARWLYLDAGGPVEATAIAETKTYRVAAVDLRRLTSVDVVEGQLVTAGQVVARLEGRPEGSILRATAPSYVSAVHARPGDVVTPGQTVATLVEARPRQVVAWLDERRGASLATGAKVVARRRDGHRQSVAGTVAAIGGEVAALPQRLWTNPHVPSWGRAVYIEVAEDAALDPGELLDILRPETAGGASQLISLLMGKPASN
jgi:multidrug resistance efflux pump